MTLPTKPEVTIIGDRLAVFMGADYKTLPLEVADKFVRVVSQQDRCDTLLAGSNDDGAERSLSDGELYFFVRASGAVLRRGHAEHVR